MPSVVCCCSNAHGSLLLAVVSGFWVSLPPPSPPFLLLHLRRTSSGQLAVCTLRWSRWLAWSRAVLVVVGCRRKWAIRGSGSGGHEPFSPSHLGSEVLRLGVGAHGWVVRFGQPSVRSPSWSWLPIVVAPGCLGHPTSTVSERRSCLMRLNEV